MTTPCAGSPRLHQALQATLRRVAACAWLGTASAHAQEQSQGQGPVPAPAHAAAAAEPARGDRCAVQSVVDPRIEELLKADPDDPQIHVTSDTGEIGRTGDAELSGNVQIHMGQRLLTADQATINAAQRSVELNGDIEYLDPQINVRGKGGSFQEGGGYLYRWQFASGGCGHGQPAWKDNARKSKKNQKHTEKSLCRCH